MTSANGQTFQSSRIRTRNRRSHLTALSLICSCGHKRTPITIRKEQGSQTPVVWPTFTGCRIAHSLWAGLCPGKLVNKAGKQINQVYHETNPPNPASGGASSQGRTSTRNFRVISYLHTDHRATLSLTLLLVVITNSVKWQFLQGDPGAQGKSGKPGLQGAPVS